MFMIVLLMGGGEKGRTIVILEHQRQELFTRKLVRMKLTLTAYVLEENAWPMGEDGSDWPPSDK